MWRYLIYENFYWQRGLIRKPFVKILTRIGKGKNLGYEMLMVFQKLMMEEAFNRSIHVQHDLNVIFIYQMCRAIFFFSFRCVIHTLDDASFSRVSLVESSSAGGASEDFSSAAGCFCMLTFLFEVATPKIKAAPLSPNAM